MKKLLTSILILLCLISVGSCEKDDICVDGDTPLLVIRFFDIANDTVLKEVPSLRVVGEGQSITAFSPDRSDLDSIAIPLQVTQNSTAFSLINSSADDPDSNVETGNIDVINFTYTLKEVYTSRACGFVMNFDNLSATLTTDVDNWIQQIIITDTLIENNAQYHVKILH
jgi:hypothetical protein